MDWITLEHFIAKGQAFLPVNASGKGDVVQLIYKDGETQLLDIQAQTFLQHILTFFGTDLYSLRRRYGPVIHKKKMIPLPLSTRWALTPFNTREAIGRQSRTGWIVTPYIQKLQEYAPGKTEITLHLYTIIVYHSKQFCLNQLRNTKLVLAEFEDIHHFPMECREPRWTYYHK